MHDVQFITLAPGHFHAALVHQQMYPGVAPRVHVYAPLGDDLLAHVHRILAFNTRPNQPTRWELEIHACPDFLPRLVSEKPGNAVVLAGRNRDKIDFILAALNAGFHVLADKPWIIRAEDQPKLESALALAEERGLVAFDMMTERHEITSILQKELIHDAAVFGTILPGTETEPGVYMESVHFIKKRVAGAPLRRPAWFFDTTQVGEGLADVGTHLVDLVHWTLFPTPDLDHRRDLRVLSARRWPTVISRTDFESVTGQTDFPDFLAPYLQADGLHFVCNTQVSYTLRGIHVTLEVRWDYESKVGGGDTHRAVYRGSRSRLEVRQGPEENYRPELYVVPNSAAEAAAVAAALKRRVSAWQADYPGVQCRDRSDGWQVLVPDVYRVGHEAHFAQVTRQFLGYLRQPGSLPKWERPLMLAKYLVTTEGVRRAETVARC
ncbi:MAG: hypothetical protein NZ700_16020 [Gemmataceae bacterium]|nr:hypothetical protein [Gemmataceae bacterium]MDW8264145.1 putative oxidoreductase C-terminal domain-containing protein [Gemmataceae bacterium]